MNKIIIVMFFGVLFAGCIPPYQPARYLAYSEIAYDETGKPAAKIECKESSADCLQEAGFICLSDGYQIIDRESMERGTVSTSSSETSAVAITKNYAVGSSSGVTQSSNILDHYMIIRCNSVDTIERVNYLQKIRNDQEAKRYAEFQKAEKEAQRNHLSFPK